MSYLRTGLSRSLSLLLALFCLAAIASAALAQDKPAPVEKKIDEINLDTQLYMIVGTNEAVGDAKMPATLDPVIKDLRASLPFKNYRLTATLINRVKTGGRLDLRWIGGPLLEKATGTASAPSFNDFFVRQVSLVEDAQGRSIIRMDGFKFGSRIPIQTNAALAANGTAVPTLSYER